MAGSPAGARHGKGAAGDYKEDVGAERRVAVTGLGAVSAFGTGVEALREGAWSGRSAIAPVSLFDASRFVARTAAEVRAVPADPDGETEDRASSLALAAAAEALAGAGFGGAGSGVAVGTTLAGREAWGRGLASGSPPLARSSPGALAALLARRHAAGGPVATVSTACASGTAAIGLAAGWIREGRATRVLAGGADALSAFVFSGFDALRALSPTAARPFDAARDGLTLGEGAGFLLLEDEEAAGRRGARVLARLTGYGSSADAFHMTRPDPRGGGLARAAEAALRDAGRAAADVGFVSAHGTGTVFNDAMEEAALAHVLGPGAGSVPVHGLKGAIGHTLGAAGALEALLCVLVLGARDVPPTAGHRAARPGSPLLRGRGGAAPSGAGGHRRPLDLGRVLGHGRRARPGAGVRRVLLAAAAGVEDAGGLARDALVDANRLRRMDRFGRSGVVAGSRALASAGVSRVRSPGPRPAPRFGVVVGTAYGCRDAITKHERLLASAARVEDLAPSVFASTVHNTVAGELAILYGLGGPAETLVSGRTAGLEALVLAASRVAKGDADRILVVAAEGIDEEMREAFGRENPGVTLVESAAAVLVEAEEEGEEEEEEEISLSKKKMRALFVGADLSFGRASRRRGPKRTRRDFSEGVSEGEARARGEAAIERLGVTGLWEIARDVAAHRAAVDLAAPAGAPRPHSPSKKIRNRRYIARDVHGSRASVTLAFFSS